MASTTFPRETQEGGSKRVRAIGDVLDAKLLFDTSAFVRLAVMPIKGRGQDLLLRCIGNQVAGELPRDEPIERRLLLNAEITQSRQGHISRYTSA